MNPVSMIGFHQTDKYFSPNILFTAAFYLWTWNITYKRGPSARAWSHQVASMLIVCLHLASGTVPWFSLHLLVLLMIQERKLQFVQVFWKKKECLQAQRDIILPNKFQKYIHILYIFTFWKISRIWANNGSPSTADSLPKPDQ